MSSRGTALPLRGPGRSGTPLHRPRRQARIAQKEARDGLTDETVRQDVPMPVVGKLEALPIAGVEVGEGRVQIEKGDVELARDLAD